MWFAIRDAVCADDCREFFRNLQSIQQSVGRALALVCADSKYGALVAQRLQGVQCIFEWPRSDGNVVLVIGQELVEQRIHPVRIGFCALRRHAFDDHGLRPMADHCGNC